MRLIFIRHGDPDYQQDCLTPLGHRQAAAVARRLQREGISRLFSSTNGRALQTAAYISQALQLPVEGCDFMREIGWGSCDGAPLAFRGHPWHTGWDMVSKNIPINDPQWQTHHPFCRNRAVKTVEAVQLGLDAWLAGLGVVREGLYYRVVRDPGTVALVCHGGSSSAALARLLNLPFPFVVSSFCLEMTGITTLILQGDEGSLLCPRLAGVDDHEHLAHI